MWPMEREELKAWRARLGLSQKAAAKALGVHWRSIQEYEAGNLPVPKLVELACKYLETQKPKGR